MKTSILPAQEGLPRLVKPPPTADEIRAQIERIVESPEFPNIGRGASFLKYVVEEALAGRANRIKGYSVAIEVFKRAEGFTQDDPVVRIEAGRLRRLLERYYLVAGAQDPIRITMPKGGYVPFFSWIEDEPGQSADIQNAIPLPLKHQPVRIFKPATVFASALIVFLLVAAGVLSYLQFNPAAPGLNAKANINAEPDGPSLAVVPFADLGTGPEASLYAQGLTEDLLTALPRFKELKVFGRETSRVLSLEANASNVRQEIGARYLLSGGVRVDDEKVRVTARLSETTTGEILWSQTYDEDLRSRSLFAIQTDVANKVATTVAQPYGIISLADIANPPPNDLAAYGCGLRFYQYLAELSAQRHLEVRYCLETTVARYPKYGTAWAMLSMIYLDEARFDYNKLDDSNPTQRALQAARTAVQLDPENSRALQALMMALFFNQQVPDGVRVGEQALAANPNDTQLMSEFGTRLALSGNWEKGSELLRQALERNPGAGGYYHAVLALAAYMQSDFATAVSEIEQADLQKFPLFHIVAAVIYAQVGRMEDAQREGAQFIKMRPGFIPNITSELTLRNIQPSDQARLIEGIRKTGIKVPASG